MKTAYEWTTNRILSIQTKYKIVNKLIKLSKQVPWILDPRVKFKGFYLGQYVGNASFWHPNVGWIPFIANEFEDPYLFIQEITEHYRLQPDWMIIEDRL